MRPVEHKVGLWFRSGKAEILTAAGYREEFVRRCQRSARPLSGPVPPAPRGTLVRRIGPSETYHIGPVASAALALLGEVRKAAGCADEETLSWVAEEYWRQSRIHTDAPYYHRDDRDAVRRQPLGRFLFRAGEQEEVQAAVLNFVKQYGCLIQDFATWRWCTSVYEAMSQLKVQFPPGTPGREDILWPRSWYGWAARIFALSQLRSERPKMPAPVALYVWAACMLGALRRHPEWGGSRVFLGRRIVSLRLASISWLNVPFGRKVALPPGPIHIQLFGELLDYLAFAAAGGPRRLALGEVYEGMCANCSRPFLVYDRRRKYCDGCSNPGTRDANRARRYREGLRLTRDRQP